MANCDADAELGVTPVSAGEECRLVMRLSMVSMADGSMTQVSMAPNCSTFASFWLNPDRLVSQHVAIMGAFIAATPIGIGCADIRSRSFIGVETQDDQRRGAPLRANQVLAVPQAPAAQPSHGGARHSCCIIPRTGNNSNRHLMRDAPPSAPTMKLGKIVRPHQPDKLPAGISALKQAKRINRVPRSKVSLDGGCPDRSATSHSDGRSVADGQWRHALNWLEDIAGRDQPPDLVQRQRLARKEAYPAMRAMRRVETAAKQAG